MGVWPYIRPFTLQLANEPYSGHAEDISRSGVGITFTIGLLSNIECYSQKKMIVAMSQ